MLFSLEALRAKHGDSLIVHFGERAQPQLIVIDGGPTGVYTDALRPRLDGLSKAIGRDGKLAIEVLMVSHIDDDHIRGVLDLSSRLLEEKDQGQPFDVRTLWLNSFDDLVGNDADELAAGVAEAPARVAETPAIAAGWQGNAQAVVASVPQGRELRDNARGLGWKANQGFKTFVMAPTAGGQTIAIDNLKLTIVCPLLPQLQALQQEWRKKLKALKLAQPAEVAEAAKNIDDSVYNLSSIVCLAELDGKRILLTGDALGKNIVEGLRAAKLLDADGTISVDVLKLPHHGSDRNIDEDFFKTIKARHYVVSGNGKYHNPEPNTFCLLSQARKGDDDFTLHLTYQDCTEGVGAELAALFAAERKAGRTYEVQFRDKDAQALRVDLLDAVDY